MWPSSFLFVYFGRPIGFSWKLICVLLINSDNYSTSILTLVIIFGPLRTTCVKGSEHIIKVEVLHSTERTLNFN